MLKKKLTRKLISQDKRSAWPDASTRLSFTRRHFSDVNEVSIVFSWKIELKQGRVFEKI